MERGDLKYLWLASQLNNQFKSDELIEATKDFSRSLAFAPTSWNMIPINDRLLYRIHVINYKINFLNALKDILQKIIDSDEDIHLEQGIPCLDIQ